MKAPGAPERLGSILVSGACDDLGWGVCHGQMEPKLDGTEGVDGGGPGERRRDPMSLVERMGHVRKEVFIRFDVLPLDCTDR